MPKSSRTYIKVSALVRLSMGDAYDMAIDVSPIVALLKKIVLIFLIGNATEFFPPDPPKVNSSIVLILDMYISYFVSQALLYEYTYSALLFYNIAIGGVYAFVITIHLNCKSFLFGIPCFCSSDYICSAKGNDLACVYCCVINLN